jgi:hypothetical protein
VDVHVADMRSTVRAVDPASLLTPELLDRLEEALHERLALRYAREHRAADERKLAGRGGRGSWEDER